MVFIKIISLLPFSLLYLLSDILYFLSRHIVRYRKKVIIENLKIAFPDKSDKEIALIAKEYYKNLTDLIVETLKVLTLKEDELKKRVSVANPDLPQSFVDQGKSLIVLTGHLCNWEWLLSACMVHFKYPIHAVYKPLNSKFSEKLMYQIRSKFGAKPTPMKDTLREEIKNKNIPHGLAMVADQTPMKNEIQYWTTFLNQDTAFYVGADKIGRMLQMPVLFVGMRRIKRGQYEIFFKQIAEPPYPEGEFYVTQKYSEMLEEEIRLYPSNWLWSHRRWKHTRESANT